MEGGRGEEWKDGRMEEGKGIGEGWKDGRGEEWKDGRMEEGNRGRMEGGYKNMFGISAYHIHLTNLLDCGIIITYLSEKSYPHENTKLLSNLGDWS